MPNLIFGQFPLGIVSLGEIIFRLFYMYSRELSPYTCILVQLILEVLYHSERRFARACWLGPEYDCADLPDSAGSCTSPGHGTIL